jgi:5-methylcytosine-specific restriction protein A
MPRKPKRPCRYPDAVGSLTVPTVRNTGKPCGTITTVTNALPTATRNTAGVWKRIRDRYAAAHPLCERCLKEGRYTPVEEVHHIVPISKGGDHRESNLMSLCQSCHTKIHVEMGDR